ncbi:YdcF family protein [Pontibacter sp. KCTC 32443]|uniref:YdcF family protein n=1 Tax=Pontibacter TaxID=323449 RepID=UPI00164D18FD|nr:MULTISPECIES: YdcF family protein [Pontibacter]MBC5772906.1 YdcF family protein [Pontibacter sp. KCTC 32443]
MFFLLSKLLHLFLMPFLWVLLFLILALLLKKPKYKRSFLFLSLGILIVFSNPFLENEAWRAWEVAAIPVNKVKHYDVAIILTGVTGYREDIPDRIHTHKGADRFLHPLQLYRLGKIDQFLISGGDGRVTGTAVPEAEQIEKVLLMAGVDEEDIITESNSRNTYENAKHTAKLLQKHPEWKTRLLVTSAYHMRRSQSCFTKAGIKADVYSTDFYSGPRYFTPDELIVPNAGSLSNWHLLIHEIAGYVMYKLMGYL